MRAWGYARVSTRAQEDNTSLAEQEARIRAWARAKGWSVGAVVTEVASGADADRPGLSELCRAVEEGDAIVVYRLDRLSRSIVDANGLIQAWKDSGVTLNSVTESLDTGTAAGELMFNMILAFAQHERRLITERMTDGKRRKAETGGFNGSPVPYGYRLGGPGERDFELVPKEAAVVAHMYRLFASGKYGVGRVRRITGCPLTDAGVAGVLANVFYTGRVRYGGVIKFNDHEAIVSDRLWNKVQVARRDRARGVSGRFFKVRENKEEIVVLH